MKIPEFLFPLLNPIVKGMLNSPLHGLMSGSVLVLYFTGRRSGISRSTPVRYLEQGDELLLLTNRNGGWWPNFLEPAAVTVQLRGHRKSGEATVAVAPDNAVREGIANMLSTYPADAAYLEIKKGTNAEAVDGRWDRESYEAAIANTVAVHINLRPGAPTS